MKRNFEMAEGIKKSTQISRKLLPQPKYVLWVRLTQVQELGQADWPTSSSVG